MKNPCPQAAVAYCAAGLSVLPWAYSAAGEKLPTRTSKGLAPLTQQEVVEHYKTRPDDNVGVHTGEISGLVIVDLDNEDAIRWATSFLPDTAWKVQTGRGQQWGYKHPGHQVKNVRDAFGVKPSGKSIQPGPQVDVRGDGGYVAMPPSLHANGNRYQWLSPGGVMPKVADLRTYNAAWLPSRNSTFACEIDLNDGLIGDFTGAQMWLGEQPPCVSGQGGQSQIFTVCCALLRDFALSWDQTWQLLCEYNKRCLPPWSRSELAHHMTGAVKRGTTPRGLRSVPYAARELQSLEKVFDGVFRRRETRTDSTPQQSTADTTELVEASAPAGSRSVSHILEAQTSPEFFDLLAAEAAFNPGAVFEPLVLDRIASVMQQDRPLFVNFQAQVRKYVSKAEMLAAVKQRGKDRRQTYMSKLAGSADLSAPVERARVLLNGDDRIVRDNVLQALKTSKSVFVSSYKLAYVDTSAKMAVLSGGSLRNAVVDLCDIVAPLPRDDGSVGSKPASLPSPVLQMLEDLLPDQLQGLRVVKQIVRTPFLTPSGQLITTPGYNEETGTLLLDCPELDVDAFPTTEAAVEYLRDLFSDFPFRGEAEFANYLGALLTPMLRHAYSGATPWLLIEANTPGAGKSLLAKCIQLIYGYPANTAVLPTEEVSIEKAMLSILSEARPVVLFDNVKALVDSPTLEAVATASEEYSGRLLGKSEVRTCPVKQLFIVTSNNARISIDGARRFLRVRLRKDHLTVAVKDAKKFRIPDLEGYIRDNRGLIVSALVRTVMSWVSDSMMVNSNTIIIPSFEPFSKTVGACVHHAGLSEWASNAVEVSQTMQSLDEWVPFAFELWTKHKDNKLTARQLYDFVIGKGLLGFTLSMAKDEHSKVSMLGVRLHERRDTPIGEFVLLSEYDKRRRTNIYWVEPQPGVNLEEEDAPPTPPPSKKVVH